MAMKRGEVYYANLNPAASYGQIGACPVLILRDKNKLKSIPTVTVAVIQAQPAKHLLPTQVNLRNNEGGLFHDSAVFLDQLHTIDQSCLQEYMGRLDSAVMDRVDRALAISLGLPQITC